MRIAQVAPLYESVPPRFYGGTERIVHYLTEELVLQGHEVTLFASGDSSTSAKLEPQCAEALRLNEACKDSLAYHVTMLERVVRREREFDVVHFHVDYLHFPISRRLRVPHVTTLHGRLDLSDLECVYREFPDVPVVSISESQRRPLRWANFVGTVHHGLPPDLLPYNPRPKEYFAFLGRVSPEKGIDRAIYIATTLGVPIKIAAKIDRADRPYFEERIEPLLAHPLVEFVGEIGEAEKAEFIGDARALLFPIDWPEPFGIVMIEAMACGTPVVAFSHGAVAEVMEHGVTGFVVENLAEAVRAAARIDEIPREGVRRAFEQRFSSRRMASEYLAVYERVARSGEEKALRTAGPRRRSAAA